MSKAKYWVRNVYTGLGGGEYTGPDSNPYTAIHPPLPMFAKKLHKMGMHRETEMIEAALRSIGWNS